MSMGKMRVSARLDRLTTWIPLGLAFVMLPACEGFGQTDGGRLPFLHWGGSTHVQEGEVVVRDGSEVQVCYKFPFASPPRLRWTVSQAWFKDKPFRESDFEIVQQDANCFKVRNNHSEVNRNSWAVVKWRAEGIGAGQGPDSGKNKQELLIARIQKAGGAVTRDFRVPGAPINGIDLHGTKTNDVDLEQLQGLATLQHLNLYGTRITDAGLVHLAGLTALQTLHLNSTAVTDAGVAYLRGLTRLKQLGLFQTGVTDAGLAYLKGMKELEELSLGGPNITDQGLAQLKGLPNLHRLLLSRTKVTKAGVQELQRTSPRLKVIY
jgi:Leucine-rich repeat (LRR) protein